MYKHVIKMPMTSVLHYMIGTAAKCWEEKHDQQVADLNEGVRTQAKIIVPLSYVPEKPVRLNRELLHYRASLIKIQTGIKTKIHTIEANS